MVREKREHTIAVMRREVGLTQPDLAKLIGVNRVTISRIEIGRDPLSKAMADRISVQTGISPDWLFGEDLENPKTIDGGAFTEQTYRYYRDVVTKSGVEQGKELAKQYAELVEFILYAIPHYLKAGKTGILATRLNKAKFELNEVFTSDLHEQMTVVWKNMHKSVKKAGDQMLSNIQKSIQPIKENAFKNITALEKQFLEEYGEEQLNTPFMDLKPKRSSKKKRKG
ncbi:helix-turn-helix transcriptional regulator [bacterium]|nr:helix-turn-helix transcriptional regulator [bacterium]